MLPMTQPLYLDYAATTPVDERVLLKMQSCLTREGSFGNASSLHAYGKQAKEAIECAREMVAHTLQALPSEIIWTSGATESINLALKGVMALYAHRGKHLVTMKTEHKAVLETCWFLEQTGCEVTVLSPDVYGLVDLDQLKHALRKDTVLVSIMHVNNETGVIQAIEKIAALTAERGILLHVDAAQSIGKLPIDVTHVPVDLLSLSAHKVYGPKGIGALYLRKKPRVRVQPLIHGGGHEQGMRSGTLPTHQIVGMGEAYRLAQLEQTERWQQATETRDHWLQMLGSHYRFTLNTRLTDTVPHIVNLRFEDQLADVFLASHPLLAASTAAACQGINIDSSYVLRAMGLSDEAAKRSIRFSFGYQTLPEMG